MIYNNVVNNDISLALLQNGGGAPSRATTSNTVAGLSETAQGLLQSNTVSPMASAGDTATNNLTSLASTGGYSPTQVSALEDQGSQAARSAYSTGSDAYSRAVAASGGYGPSGAATDMLARKGSEAGSTAAVNTDATVAQNQINNMLSANSGLSSLAGLSIEQQQNLLNTILGSNAQQVNLSTASTSPGAGTQLANLFLPTAIAGLI